MGTLVAVPAEEELPHAVEIAASAMAQAPSAEVGAIASAPAETSVSLLLFQLRVLVENHAGPEPVFQGWQNLDSGLDLSEMWPLLSLLP